LRQQGKTCKAVRAGNEYSSVSHWTSYDKAIIILYK